MKSKVYLSRGEMLCLILIRAKNLLDFKCDTVEQCEIAVSNEIKKVDDLIVQYKDRMENLKGLMRIIKDYRDKE